MKPLINVLIRTRHCPGGYKNAYSSVVSQNYKRLRIITSVDSDESMKYVKKYSTDIVRVKHQPKIDHLHAPYNLYLNDLFDAVEDGWIFILDDDDFINTPDFFRTIYPIMAADEDTLLIWRMRMISGRQIPETEYFNKTPEAKHIGMPCFTFHSKYKHLHTFDKFRRGDFNLISSLYPKIPHKVWIDKTFIQLGNNGRFGKTT